MSYADKILKDVANNVLSNGISTSGQNVRAKWKDGDPAHTKKVFGVVTRYDLSKEFPICTLRPINWRKSLEEILWIFQRQSNNIKDLDSKIWDSWADKDGSIGKAYGYQLEGGKTKQIIKVEQKIKSYHGKLNPIKIANLEDSNPSCTSEHCGKTYTSGTTGDFKVLDVFTIKENSGKYRSFVKLQFISTGYICVRPSHVVYTGEVKDIYARTYCGIGYFGDIDSVENIEPSLLKTLKNRWCAMLKRCYEPSDARYPTYGEMGVFVDERWHSLENYVRDVRTLPQYMLAKRDNFKNWQIDKDYWNSNCYSKETCVWLTNTDNKTYSKAKPFVLYHSDYCPDGDIFLNVREATEKYNTSLDSLIYSGRKNRKGFTFKYLDNGIYRYRLSSNQVNDVLYKLKHNPYDRRIMTNFWNFKDAPEKNLQECAYSLTFDVTDGKLNMMLNQRSGDLLAAAFPGSWNVVGYAFLQHMFAIASGLKIGELVHVIANAHIYDKHIPLVEELLTREEYPAPTLWIDPTITNFYDFKPEHFQLHNYKTGEQIKDIPIAI